MYGAKDGFCVECQCGCHAKPHAVLAAATKNLKDFGVEALKWLFWGFVVFCMAGGLSR